LPSDIFEKHIGTHPFFLYADISDQGKKIHKETDIKLSRNQKQALSRVISGEEIFGWVQAGRKTMMCKRIIKG